MAHLKNLTNVTGLPLPEEQLEFCILNINTNYLW